jgi:2-desacetyl-2-hydroxyethyl bacteriochlorophyllide A dehydrogenase
MRYVEVSPGSVVLCDGPSPELHPGTARVSVRACGVCGSDRYLLRGMVLPRGATYPVRPGHEVAGVVTEVSVGVGGLSPGDDVVLHPLAPCGSCRSCRSDQEQRCAHAVVLGLQAPGGMADEVVWPAVRMVRVTNLSPSAAALLPDAVATAHHAIRVAALSGRERLCLIGVGGLGTHVLELASVLHPDLEVAAVVRSTASVTRLERMGILAVAGLEGAAKRLRRDGARFDAVIDFSGSPTAPAEAVRLLNPGGRLVLGSIADEPLDLGTSLTGLVTRELEIVGCYASTMEDLRQVALLAQDGRLPGLPAAVSHRVPLSEAPAAFRVLVERPPHTIRVVLEPGS